MLKQNMLLYRFCLTFSMSQASLILVIVLLSEIVSEEVPVNLVDVESLTTLPLDTLLNIKTKIAHFDDGDKTENVTAKENSPEALPFHGTPSKKQGYYSHFVEEDDSKYTKKGVSKVFQTSVTTLAFLAFGGYLLFLIIAAIKSKQNNYMYDPNNTQIMQAMINAQLNKRKKKKRRPIRGDGAFGYKGQDSLEFQPYKEKREIMHNNIDVDEMYKALLNLCEGYRKSAIH